MAFLENIKKYKSAIIIIIFFLVSIIVIDIINKEKEYSEAATLRILSSAENEILSEKLEKYAESIGIKLIFDYAGDIDIVDKLNNNSQDYDAVWISNSMWLYMLNNPYLTSDSKSVSISPVVFGIRKNKAKELKLTGNNISNNTILNLINEKKIKYVMPSVTQTNTGATAYLGFLASLAGNPEVLTEEMLNNEQLLTNLKKVFSGVERVSGDEGYLEEMFINNDSYEAVIASEASLININKELKKQKKQELYLIYPEDGVAINDSIFAFINNNSEKETAFLEIQNYLLSDEGQKMLQESGLRTWYGGVTNKADKNVFNPNWGIDTTKYLNVTKYPTKNVITSAINLYIEKLRKPTHVVFCLDYSGSMSGVGKEELVEAMDYILDYDKASKDKLQFSDNDKITVIPFSSNIHDIWKTDSGKNTTELITNIKTEEIGRSTALYGAIIEGVKILSSETDEYTKTIIAMTDGEANVGSFEDLSTYYNKIKSKIPIYSITFGSASEYQLNKIADLSNAKVFNGKAGLLEAFKEVRGYN